MFTEISDDVTEYAVSKAALLTACEIINEETYRIRFRTLQKNVNGNYIQYAYKIGIRFKH